MIRLNAIQLLNSLLQLDMTCRQVEQRGHFAVRGDILDIYPVNSEHPIRIEFFGDEIDTLRFFSVENQRSIEQIDSYTVTPFFLGKSDADCTLLSFVKEGTLIYDEPGRIQEALKKFLKEILHIVKIIATGVNYNVL